MSMKAMAMIVISSVSSRHLSRARQFSVVIFGDQVSDHRTHIVLSGYVS